MPSKSCRCTIPNSWSSSCFSELPMDHHLITALCYSCESVKDLRLVFKCQCCLSKISPHELASLGTDFLIVSATIIILWLSCPNIVFNVTCFNVRDCFGEASIA